MTADFMSDEHRQEIVAAAFLETGEQAREESRAEALSAIGGRRAVA
jgi:hypothetical protein